MPAIEFNLHRFHGLLYRMNLCISVVGRKQHPFDWLGDKKKMKFMERKTGRAGPEESKQDLIR